VILLKQKTKLNGNNLKNEEVKEAIWFEFLPSMIFVLLCDIEILVQLWFYKPIAFKKEANERGR
jgi:hypothetical protein